MQNIEKYEHCSNCGACYNLCPQDAIFVESDGLYYQPKVDHTKCVECGLCLQRCPVNQRKTNDEYRPIKAYGGKNRDKTTVMKSSSGGVFSALAEHVIAKGGMVYGAVFTDDCKQVVIDSTENCTLDQIRRSKYVESAVGMKFREIKGHLENTTPVLFCGTPCQVAGLNAFLGKKYENLITCDFACGGLPSHKIFEKYLEELQIKYHAGSVKEVNFRPKIYGWRTHAIAVTFSNKRKYKQLAAADPFFHAFVSERTLQREYCYDCGFSDHHEADIVLADFWLFFKFDSFKEPFDGLSLVISNSEKGQKTMEAIAGSVALTELPLEEGCYNFKKTTADPAQCKKREEYLREFEKNGVFYASSSGSMITGKAAAKARLKAWIKSRLRRTKS